MAWTKDHHRFHFLFLLLLAFLALGIVIIFWLAVLREWRRAHPVIDVATNTDVSSIDFTNTELGQLPLTDAPAVGVNDPSRGPKDARVTIIEYGDFQCEDCANVESVLGDVLEAYPTSVQLVWKDFPVTTVHFAAEQAALAARCAQEQNQFWEMHDFLLNHQDRFGAELFQEGARALALDETQYQQCQESGVRLELVQQSLFEGKALGVEGAPTFFINGRNEGQLSTLEEFQKILQPLISNP
jgi:protein-disulfide isomerase